MVTKNTSKGIKYTFEEIIEFLKAHENIKTVKTLKKHGGKDPIYGVKVSDLKIIVKNIKKDYELSKKLYETGISDAMYLAGLIADEKKMTKEDLNNWVKAAYWYYISDFTVAWVASESDFARELALEWIESDDEMISSAGWSTYASLLSIKEDKDLNMSEIMELLNKGKSSIHGAKNRTKISINNFIISVASYVKELYPIAVATANEVGKVETDRGDTSCKTPFAPDYIKHIAEMGRVGKKRKNARC